MLVSHSEGQFQLQLAANDHTDIKLGLRSCGIEQLNLNMGSKQGQIFLSIKGRFRVQKWKFNLYRPTVKHTCSKRGKKGDTSAVSVIKKYTICSVCTLTKRYSRRHSAVLVLRILWWHLRSNMERCSGFVHLWNSGSNKRHRPTLHWHIVKYYQHSGWG